MIQDTLVYVALGGNVGDTAQMFQQALLAIQALGVRELTCSRFYVTTPVSDIPQNYFLNAVCRFRTNLNAKELLAYLQDIERALGKKEKAKSAPRIIDLDILFFGLEQHHTAELEIPHPRWRQRLFVLIPLLELTSEITFPDNTNPSTMTTLYLPQFLKNFSNIHKEVVLLWKE